MNLITILVELALGVDPFDNIFSANHRNKMISEYGYTEAMILSIEDLLLTI